MISRCENPNATSYPRYGARGIRVCNRWRSSFANFFADVGHRPSANHSIDRINSSGDYEPGNVRWATAIEQTRGRQKTIWIEWQGRRITLAEACDAVGLRYATAWARLQKGLSIEKVLAPIGAPNEAQARN